MEGVEEGIEDCRYKILIVDDYSGIRRVLARLINRQSDLVVSALVGSVTQALCSVEFQTFDLAIVDISLNGTSGFDFIGLARSRCPNMPVIVYSAHDESAYVTEAFRLGARGYIVKPADTPKEIVTAIRQVLEGKIYASPGVRKLLDK